MMRLFFVLVCANLFVVENCVAQAMFRGDAAHSGVFTSNGPRQFHRLKWSFQTGNQIVSSPTYHDGVIYVGSNDGFVYAIEAKSGKQLWRYATGGPVPSSPAIRDGLVYFASYDGKFYALNAKTGVTKWKFTSAGERRFEAKGIHGQLPKTQTYPDIYDTYLSSPVVAQDTVYFGSGDGHVYALDAHTGVVRWKFSTGNVVHASPVYANGVLYIGSWDSNLYAIDATTGKEQWRFKSGDDEIIHNQVGFQGSPAVVDGVVYVGCRDSHLYAIDAKSGKEKWNISTGLSWVITSPAVHLGKVYYATSDTALFSIADANTGKPLAETKSTSYLWSSPAIAGDVVFIGNFSGSLEARDSTSGELLWEFQT
nr:PQQ-like beta-propeller repeat protein [Arenimonas sp.]